ncbi:MAG: DUF642 domain-containing protein [Aureispira sp.]
MKTTLLFIICLFLQTNAFSQNLFQNSKFQDGVTHWHVLLENADVPIKAQIIEHSKDYGQYGLADNYVNTSFVELDAKSAIQQEVATTQQNNYVLTFAHAHRPDAGKKQLIVLVDQKVVFTKTIDNNSSVGIFKYETIHFTAPQNNSKISFYAVSLSGVEDQGILLTDISCEMAAEINLFDQREQKTH